jgi:hypothetical protein
MADDERELLQMLAFTADPSVRAGDRLAALERLREFEIAGREITDVLAEEIASLPDAEVDAQLDAVLAAEIAAMTHKERGCRFPLAVAALGAKRPRRKKARKQQPPPSSSSRTETEASPVVAPVVPIEHVRPRRRRRRFLSS